MKIKSLGHFLPEEIVDNEKLLENTNLPINSQWIEKRVGVKARHKIADNMTNLVMKLKLL